MFKYKKFIYSLEKKKYVQDMNWNKRHFSIIITTGVAKGDFTQGIWWLK